MKLYFTFTKRSLLVLLCAVFLTLLIVSRFSASGTSAPKGNTNAKRLEFLSSIGISKISEECSFKEIILPSKFSRVLENYNELQKKAGFGNLKDYIGAQLNLYTYEFKNGLGAVHIITYKDRIIGGDIADYSVQGKILPLCKENTNE